jgi:hypothetical protein
MRATRQPIIAIAAFLSLVFTAPAFSQTLPPPAKSVSLAGPRVGITMLSPGVIDALAERDIAVRPVITQFGWQFEKQFFTTQGGLTAVTELVGLLGGLEQSLTIPSMSWMVGLRTSNGAEFGIGPNLTPAGAALAIAAGVTIRSGVVNIPVNVAIVPSKAGVRLSVLTGFNLRGRR